MRNFTQRTSVRILTQVVLVSLFVIQNHCGLLAASSLIQKAASISSLSSSSHQQVPPCHAKASSKDSKSCGQDCCTRLQAVSQNQEIKIFLKQALNLSSEAVDSLPILQPVFTVPKFSAETPPHLSFQRSFYQEAFPSHAPPLSILA
ncbi:MAG: hypothetical protein EXS63_03065 [Candidatus Omnitrophica bacterium]|nr:hypothetical protein [Candidatus Omnitrophota bacterium]